MRGFEIKSIEVMRGTDAIGRFGERAANGVVLLTTKD
jgi:TonB-dependent SusC/RagA subfamily outer membrane receptor